MYTIAFKGYLQVCLATAIIKFLPNDNLFNGSQNLAVCVTGAGAGVDSAREQKKLEARKMLVNRADSQKSAARFVGRFFPLFNKYLDRSSTFLLLQNGKVHDIFICTWSVDVKAVVNRHL